MSNQSIKYGILLTKEQLDFLKDDRQGFHRMTAFDTFVSIKESRILSPIQISIIASVLRPNVPNTPIFSVDQPPN